MSIFTSLTTVFPNASTLTLCVPTVPVNPCNLMTPSYPLFSIDWYVNVWTIVPAAVEIWLIPNLLLYSSINKTVGPRT